LVDPQKQILIQ